MYGYVTNGTELTELDRVYATLSDVFQKQNP
jgi:hypothetical protein